MKKFIFLILFCLSLNIIGCSQDYVIYIPNIEEQKEIKWAPYQEGLLNSSDVARKPFLLYFGSDTCAPCKNMEESTFQDRLIINNLNKNFFPIKISEEKDKEIFAKLSVKYEFHLLPAIIIVSSNYRIFKYRTRKFSQSFWIC